MRQLKRLGQQLDHGVRVLVATTMLLTALGLNGSTPIVIAQGSTPPPAESPTVTPSPTGVSDVTATPEATATPLPTETVPPMRTHGPLVPIVTPTATPSPTSILPGSEDITGTITTEGGELVYGKKHELKLVFPQDAVKEKVKVNIKKLDRLPKDLPIDADYQGYGVLIDIKKDKDNKKIDKTDKAIRIELKYRELFPDLDIQSLKLLSFYHFNTLTNQWEQVPTAVSTEMGLVFAQLDSFSPVALTSGTNTASGDYAKAWQPAAPRYSVDTFNGGTTWSMPFDIPAGRGGLKPDLSLSYSSTAVDELRGDANPQMGAIGMGWSFTIPSIERVYANSSSDGLPRIDMSNSAIFRLSMDGVSSKLVCVDTTVTPCVEYRGEDESFVRVKRLFGSPNESNDTNAPASYRGEYWQVWTKDGLEYRFGYSGATNEQSAFYLYGRQEGGANTGQVARFIWRWNLDRITDPHNNYVTFNYERETKNLALNGYGLYVRGGNLTQVVYTKNDSLPASPAPYQINVTSVTTTTVYPSAFDGPGYDNVQVFFSKKLLTGVTLNQWNGSSYATFLTYSLSSSAPASDGLLRLNSVQTIGRNGLVQPPALFSYLIRESYRTSPDGGATNGCDVGNNYPNNHIYDRIWLDSVVTGSGAYVNFNYTIPLATSSKFLPDPQYPTQTQNGYVCDRTADRNGKYWIRHRLREMRVVPGVGAEMRTVYEYRDAANTGLAQGYWQNSSPETWPRPDYPADPPREFRGYPIVRVYQLDMGREPDPVVSYQDVYFHQGISPTAITVCGGSVLDDNNAKLQGKQYRAINYDANNTTLSSSETRYDSASLTNGRRFVYTKAQCEYQQHGVTSASKRTEFDHETTYGNQTQVREFAQADAASPYRTTVTDYATTSPTRWIVGLPYRVQVFEGSSMGTLRSKTEYCYDRDGSNNPICGATSPAKGTQTRVTAFELVSGTQSITINWYDAQGNRTQTQDPRGNTTTFSYDTTFYQFPVSQCNSTVAFCSYTDFYGLSTYGLANGNLGQVYRTYDSNGTGAATIYVFDGLARLIQVFRPGDSGPTTEYQYRDPLPSNNPLVPQNNADFEAKQNYTLQTIPGEPGLEAGDTWTNWIVHQSVGTISAAAVSSPVHTGQRSLKLISSDDNNWIANRLLAWQPGVTYRISAWVKMDPGSWVWMGLASNSTTGPFDNTYQFSYVNSNWRLIEVDVTLPSNALAYNRIGVVAIMYVQGTVHVDNFMVGRPQEVGTLQRENSSGTNMWSREVYDGLGRVVQKQSEINGSQATSVGTLYNALGQRVLQTMPGVIASNEQNVRSYVRPDWSTLVKAETQYDALGRVAQVTNSDGVTTRTAYFGWQTAVLDANGRQRISETDAFGRLILIREYNATLAVTNFSYTPVYATTQYGYNVLDTLTTVTDTVGNVTSLTYDSLGRKLTMNDPDMGVWQYGYDAAGNIVQQIDARGQRICSYYDALNRIRGKNYQNSGNCPTTDPGSYAVTYAYDAGTNGKGRRTSMSDSSGSTVWSYDARGRLLSETKTINGYGVYVTSRQYDSMDRVTQITYPNGEVVNQSYSAQGMLLNVQSQDYGATGNYATNIGHDAAGRLTSIPLGNSLTTTFGYYPWTSYGGRLQILQTGSYQNLTYTYDAIGQVRTIADGTNHNATTNPTGGQTQTFEYDALDRLTRGYTTGGSATYDQSFTYTAIGNFDMMAGVEQDYNGVTLSGQNCQSGTLASKPHAVTHLNGQQRLWYDCNGNMTRRIENTVTADQTWDSENRLGSVTQTVTETWSSLNTTRWQYNCGLSTGCFSIDNGSLKIAGSDVNGYYSEYIRVTEGSQIWSTITGDAAGQSIQLDFRVDGPNNEAFFFLESITTPYRRFGIVANNNTIFVEYSNGSGYIYPATLVSPIAINSWYTVKLTLTNAASNNATVQVWPTGNPGSATSATFTLATGQNWRFHSLVYAGNIWVDNQQDYDVTRFVYDGDGMRTVQYLPDGSKTAYVGNLAEVDCQSLSPTASLTPAGSTTAGTQNISWSAVANATGYIVYVDESGPGSTGWLTDPTDYSNTNYTSTTLSYNFRAGYRYSIGVYGFNSCTTGNGSWKYVNVPSPNTPTPTPTNTATATSTNTPTPGSGGSLSGSIGTPGSSVNLTTEGTADWTHWGRGSASGFDRKNSVTAQISNYTQIGSTAAGYYNDNLVGFSWTDGTPTTSATNNTEAIYIYGLNNGSQITAPADTTLRTLRFYMGVWNARGRLQVSLSDNSAPAYIDTSLNNTTGNNGGTVGVYTLTYRAASAGQTLTVQWTVMDSYHTIGNVQLQAATLQVAGPTPTPTATAAVTCAGTGATREVWTGITGETVADLLTGTNNFANTPNTTDTRTTFEAPTDWADNYGTRMRTLLCVPSSGSYTFWIAGDDNSALRLNTTTLASPNGADWNALASAATEIASVANWTNSREWDKYTTQRSNAIALSPGWYYLEARHKEGTGGDNLAVAWRLNNTTTPATGDGSFIIPQANLYPVPAGPTPTPTNTPTRTPTPTNTPVGPTNTPTRTPTPTNTPTRTPTPTNTTSGCPTSDDFNRGNNTDLGANWTERLGNLEINTNLLRNVSTDSDNIATICGTYSNALVSSQVQITTNGTGTVSVAARLGGYSGGTPSQGYAAEIESNGTVKLWRVDNWTLLGSSTISGFSLGTWYTLGLRANGNQISVEVNGNTVIGPVTNAAFTSGNAGVWSYSPNDAGSHQFDNFSVTVLGGGLHTKTKVLAITDARRAAAITPPATGQTWRLYYYANTRSIAVRVLPPGNTTGTLSYLLSDHLGSMSASIDPSLNASRQFFYPFGDVRPGSGTLPTARGFTGQYSDASTGLMYYNARYYSPDLGRFVSADTIVPSASNPQALNRYTYVHNSPVNFADSTGHCGPLTPVCVFLLIAAVVGGGHMVETGLTVSAVASQSPAFRQEQAAIQQWQDNCMGACHYSHATPSYPSGTPLGGPRPETPATDLFSSGMADTTMGAAQVMSALVGMGQIGSASVPSVNRPSPTTSNFLTNVATRAENAVGGQGSVPGTLRHTYAERMINRYQGMYGPVGDGLTTEVSYAAGQVVARGTPGSVRLDVVEGGLRNPTAVYDFKFGSAGLSPIRLSKIATATQFTKKTPVLTIRPQ